MSRDDDEDAEALSWIGDRDDTHTASRLRPGTTAQDAGDDAADSEADDGDAPRLSSLALVGFGVLAGVYLLYTVGWVNAVLGSLQPVGDLFATVMVQFGQFLAIASPALWFAASILLTRDRRPLVRVLWVVLGLLVVAPWPLVLGW